MRQKKLYHYCSVENFHKIIESKSIWLSNCSQMNDSKETTWIEAYFDFVLSNFADDKYDEFQKFVLPTYGWNKQLPYMFCLSELRDSLSQWRAYASDGKGVAIGFNMNSFGLKKDVPSRSVFRDNTLGICKVQYNLKVQQKLLKNLVEEFREMYDKKEEDLWEVAPSFLAFRLVDFSLVFKNPSFSEEREWRVLHTPLENFTDYEDMTNEHNISDIRFRTIGNKITSYSILNFENKFDSKLIPEIVLGPKSEVDLGILELFLKANDLRETKIIKSDSTYK